MSLLSRLINPDYNSGEERVPIEPYIALLSRAVRGEQTMASAKNNAVLNLNEAEKAAMVTMYNAVVAGSLNSNNVPITIDVIRDALHVGETLAHPIAAVRDSVEAKP